MRLTRLIYFSENQIDTGDGSVIRQLSKILSASNRNNKLAGLTGALVFDDMWFFQAIEGPRDTIWKTFDRIKEDDRHANVVIVNFCDVEDRLFGNWWMGLARLGDDNRSVFKPYLREGRLNPQNMTAKEILALMKELSAIGLSREVKSEAASI